MITSIHAEKELDKIQHSFITKTLSKLETETFSTNKAHLCKT